MLSASNIEKDAKDLNDPHVERDVIFLLKKYIKEDSWLDFPANAPTFLFFLIYGLPTTPDDIEREKNNWVFNAVMALKLFRLAHAAEIADSITRLM